MAIVFHYKTKYSIFASKEKDNREDLEILDNLEKLEVLDNLDILENLESLVNPGKTKEP